MSSPILYKAVYASMGVMAGVGAPSTVGWLTYQYTGNIGLAAVLIAASVYQLMALTVAVGSVSQYVPEDLPLGPSFLAGHGLLTLSITLIPLFTLPGLVWLYLLPVDENGFFSRDAWLGLDEDGFETPHHDGGAHE